MRNQSLRVFGVAGLFAALLAAPAYATLTVKITDTASGTVSYSFGSCPGLSTCLPNTVVAVLNDADFAFSIDIANSSSPGQAQLTFSGTENSILGGPLTIAISDNGFLFPSSPFSTLAQTVTTNTSTTPTAKGTLSATGYYDPSNVEFDTSGTATPTATLAAFALATQHSSTTVTGSVPFALNEVLRADFTNGGTYPTGPAAEFSATLSVTAIPEPATVVLFGFVLLFTAGAVRRRRAASQKCG